MASWRVEPQRVGDTWFAYRQVSPAWPPLYHAAGEPSPSQESARWHRRGEGYCQYTSLSPLGAWAECVRYLSIRSAEQAAEQRRNLWLIAVSERDIADLASFDLYDACGLDPRTAVGDHTASQNLADELRAGGFRGVVSPSAALPGAVNLTLFGERYEQVLSGEITAWSNPDPSEWLTVQLAAEHTGPPAELCVETCFLSQPHRGYREWLKAHGKPMPTGAP